MKFLLPVYFCSLLIVNADSPTAKITGAEDGWKPLLKADFKPVNGAEDTWKFDDAKQIISCTGQPVGVIASATSMKISAQ